MRLADLAAAIEARLIGDGDVDVSAVRAVDDATACDVTFAAHAHERRAAFSCAAAAVIVDEAFAADHAHELPCAVLCADSPPRALQRAIEVLHAAPASRARHRGIHPSAVVAASARFGTDVDVGALCVVGRDVVVGDGCVLLPGAILLDGVRLGNNVRVGPGSVVGDDGFVFAPGSGAHRDENLPIRHLASVVLEDGVELGANVCVDRGFLRDTVVGARTRVDNLVQVAHDVVIGADSVVTAQVGIAGYARLGRRVAIAGQAGINPHARLADDVRVGGQSGVTHDVVDVGAVVSGTPAFGHHEWLKAMARLKTLDALEKRVRLLEQQLAQKQSQTQHQQPAENPGPTPESKP